MAKKIQATKTAAKAPKGEAKNAGWRVYKIDDGLRSAIQRKRASTDCCTRELIECAITEKLPVLVSGLAALGLTAKVGAKRRPARWNVSDETLGALRVASAQTGLAASRLLEAALTLLCSEAPKTRKSSKKGGAA
jgi:hypothetical protein